MQCVAAHKIAATRILALREAIHQAHQELSSTLSCVIVFLGGRSDAIHDQQFANQLAELRLNVPIFGCTSASIAGTGCEIEGQPSASVVLIGGLSEPPRVFEMEYMDTPDGPSVLGVDEEMISAAQRANGLLVHACPMTFSIEMLYDSLTNLADSPSEFVPVIGGYCSNEPWGSRSTLICNDRVINRGAVGLIMPPELRWDTVVSQGCRPIGEPMVITALDGTTILGLGGKPALARVREMFMQLPNRDREMAVDALLIGRAITEYSESFSHGDFLIRNVVGIDPDREGVEVTDRFHVGQTVRFHVRDRDAATGDMTTLLSRAAKECTDPLAALMYSCNGRGSHMFGETGHDAMVIEKYFPGLPVAGMFAAGEFGPISRRNLIHGFTAVTAILRKSAR